MDIAILVVEDDQDARETVAAMLRRDVREVRTAADGREGLEIFGALRPDVVVTDIRMPVMNGLAMAREIRALAHRVPIIVTTAHNDTEFFLEAIDIGIDHYVLKPVDRRRLIAAVNRCVEVISLERTVAFKDQEQKRLINELKEALASIRTLRGLIPICSGCKKIRDDQGYWNQLEAYIRDHTDAEFSHGICPDCAVKFYPDYVHKIDP